MDVLPKEYFLLKETHKRDQTIKHQNRTSQNGNNLDDSKLKQDDLQSWKRFKSKMNKDRQKKQNRSSKK